MIDQTLTKARQKYEEIIKGHAGGWFDYGEYESLKQTWFDTFALMLIENLEQERGMERDEHS